MFQVFRKAIPVHLTLLTTPVHPLMHHSDGGFVKPIDAPVVLTYPIILEMSPQLSYQDFPPFYGFNLVSDPVERVQFLDRYDLAGSIRKLVFAANIRLGLYAAPATQTLFLPLDDGHTQCRSFGTDADGHIDADQLDAAYFFRALGRL